MDTETDSERTESLVIEAGTGTVFIDGERIELPLKEFNLLAELAACPGEAIATADLLARVWPENPYMPPREIHWWIWRLRGRIGDDSREKKLIANRPRFGFYLDLPPASVRVVGTAHLLETKLDDSQAPAATPGAAALASENRLEPAAESSDEATEDGLVASSSMSRLAGKGALVLAMFVVVLLSASWAAGYIASMLVSSDDAEPSRAGTAASQPEDPLAQEPEHRSKDPRSHPARKQQGGKPKASNRRGQRSPVIAAPATTGGGSYQAPPQEPSKGGGQQHPNNNQAAPSLPPAPTRYLYHLVNTETGDHFVTTDANAASQYEAQGYTGGAIGRVYTASQDGTKAISTDQGNAYIFLSASPKTEPASTTLTLWYSSNDQGDFFYTTIKSEATQEGWSSQVIGYVRSP